MTHKLSAFPALAAALLLLTSPVAAQTASGNYVYNGMGKGPQVAKTYGRGLPRDSDTLLFRDDQYPVWPLTASQQQYAPINGQRMKGIVQDLSVVAERYRDLGHKWWGRLPGTSADKEGMAYITKAYTDLGLKVEQFPYVIPHDWRPTDWSASYTAADGRAIELTTSFPVADTKDTGGMTVTAEAVWVGIGAGADFLGRDIKGKAVVIYTVFVPGGRSHSASDRARLFDANTRAEKAGAAMIINVVGVPGNGQYQPEGGNPRVPHFTLSMDEGFALRDELETGRKVNVSFGLTVPELTNIQTTYSIATLPGTTDEEIVVLAHTDGYFQAAMDNAAGVASAIEIARFYAAKPQSERRRTIKFITFTDHHHGEVARGRKDVGIDATYNWSKVAVKLTMEHPSQTLLYMYNDSLTPTNGIGAFRWNALGSPQFEQMVFDTFKEYGVQLYAMEDGPKNGNYAPSFHIIDHVIYHTSLDVPELVPATGLERSTRAFVSILDRANEMSMSQLRGGAFPPARGQGSLVGPQSIAR